MSKNTFGNYKFPGWVNEQLREQIKDFWGWAGRTYKDWLSNPKQYIKEGRLPVQGSNVAFYLEDYKTDKYSRITGKYLHAWNNMGRLVLKDKSYKVVSSCDAWHYLKGEPKQ